MDKLTSNSSLEHVLLCIHTYESMAVLEICCGELLAAGTISHVELYESFAIQMQKGILSKQLKPKRNNDGLTAHLLLPQGQLEHVLSILKEQMGEMVAYTLPLLDFHRKGITHE